MFLSPKSVVDFTSCICAVTDKFPLFYVDTEVRVRIVYALVHENAVGNLKH